MIIGQYIRYEPIIKFIKKNKPNKILEIGSGSQGLGKFMNIKFTGLDKTTSDYGEKELKTNKNMQFVEGSADNIPFPDGSFDFVFSLDMLEHIPKNKREQTIKEMLSVSSKYMILGFPCGKLAMKLDQKIYEKKLKNNQKVPGWLDEHIKIGLPNENEINYILKRILINNENISLIKMKNSQLFSIINILNNNNIKYISYTISSVLLFFIKILNINFVSKNEKYYRLFLFIEK